MTPEEHPFTPDEVDERIDQSSPAGAAPPSSDQRLVQSLHALYSAEAREMTNALERGRERLSQSLASLPTSSQREGLASDAQHVLFENQSAGLSPQERPLSAKRWPLRFASLAAAVLLVVLVGSLVAGLILVRHNPTGAISKPNATTQPSATITSAPAQTNLYLMSRLISSSIVKVDTATRRIAWTYTWNHLQSDAYSFGPLLVGDGSVYFSAGAAPAGSDSTSKSLYALNATNGALRWQNTSLSNNVVALLIGDGVVYVISGTDLYAFNASDGSTRWHTQVGDNVSKLAIAHGVLYGTTFQIDSGQWFSSLFAVNAADGTLLWQSALPANRSFTVAAVVDGTIYLSSVEQKYPTGGEKSIRSDGKPKISYVYAYSLTGKQLWQSQKFEGFLTTPTIGNGAVYFAGVDAYALNARDGSLLWDYPVDTGVIQYGALAFANGTVYLESSPNSSGGSVDSFLIALDGQTGHVQWKQKLNTSANGFALANGFLYTAGYIVGSGNPSSTVEAYNASDGSLAWQMPIEGLIQPMLIAAP